jgi:putative ABC transport system permease protein
MDVDPSLWGLLASGVLIAVAVALSLAQRLSLERPMLWAAARALAQLLAIGLLLAVVLADDAPLWWSWLWVLVMVAFAAVTTSRRAPEVPGVLVLSLVAYAAAATVSLGVLFGLGVFELQPRTLVPLAGMLIGNSLASTVLVGRRVVEGLLDRSDEVEARLALGMTAREAGAPMVRDAVRTALIPQIETTKAVGIVFLPGAMVGLILAGAEPAAAVKVQIAVMYLVLGSVATTTAVVALGVRARAFSEDHRLVLERR